MSHTQTFDLSYTALCHLIIKFQGILPVLSGGGYPLSCLTGVPPPRSGPGTGLWTEPVTGLGDTSSPSEQTRRTENITFPSYIARGP